MRKTLTMDDPEGLEREVGELHVDDTLERDVEALRQMFLAFGRVRSLRDPFALQCEAMYLTPAQLHSLIWLGHDAPLTMGELARRLGVTEKTITGVVDRLELAALAVRERDSIDRRQVKVSLAPKGEEIFREVDLRSMEMFRTLLGLLDPAERQTLFDLLKKFSERALPSAGGSGESP